jgi:hypothetical protein
MTHKLKIWPEYFQAVLSGRMKFQLRRADRDFRVGDQLLLEEWDPEPDQTKNTGRQVLVRVDYIMDLTGISGEYVIMSISLV